MRGGKGWEALFSFGLAQGVAFVATLVRIPFAIESVGAAGLGVLALAVALGPWLCLMAVSTRSAIRILEGEGGLGGKAGKDVLAAAAALTGRFGLYVAALGVILLLGVSVGPRHCTGPTSRWPWGSLSCARSAGARLGPAGPAGRRCSLHARQFDGPPDLDRLAGPGDRRLRLRPAVLGAGTCLRRAGIRRCWIASLLPTAYVQRDGYQLGLSRRRSATRDGS